MNVGFSYTRFGYRQNSRTHFILHLRWPMIRVHRVPAFCRLQRSEVLKRTFRFGVIETFAETGDPRYGRDRDSCGIKAARTYRHAD